MRRQHFVVQLHESDCSQYTNLSKWMSWLSTRTHWRVPAAWKKVSSRFVGGSVSQDVCLWIIDDKLIDFFLQCFSTSPIISHLRMCVCVWKRESCTECQHDATHTQSPITQHTHTHTHTHTHRSLCWWVTARRSRCDGLQSHHTVNTLTDSDLNCEVAAQVIQMKPAKHEQHELWAAADWSMCTVCFWHQRDSAGCGEETRAATRGRQSPPALCVSVSHTHTHTLMSSLYSNVKVFRNCTFLEKLKLHTRCHHNMSGLIDTWYLGLMPVQICCSP